MTAFQKVIKYVAIAFALCLIVSIFSGIITGISSISSLFISDGNAKPVGETKVYEIDGEVNSLSIDLAGTQLKIQTADKFFVESNHKYISVKNEGGKLRITEAKELFNFASNNITVILNIPQNFTFDNAEIDTGAGTVKIDSLSADVLDLTLGAGKADIKNLTANSRAEIEGGAGELNIDGGKLNNLDLEMGVGSLKLKSRIEGKSQLDYGVGETKLTLIGSREDYQIELDKGLGEAKLSGEEMKDDSVYGSGENHIDIDGGVGSLKIDFSQE
ncbi:MAG: DUF4097 family beta strand repeat-containing protein [Acutalibacteraceae bacterium]